jgi:hypothetical protein
MRRSSSALAVAAVGAAATAAAATPPARDPAWLPNTTVSCGAIHGVWDPAHAGVAAFLGVPFAAPPVGSLRWRPPIEATCWPSGSSFPANESAPACPQMPKMPAYPDAESCLFLNVFAAWDEQTAAASAAHTNHANNVNTAAAADKKPVLVWLHGGGNVYGSAGSYGDIQSIVPSLGGEAVLVALQFRLNGFGFLALSELSATDPRGNTSGNYGILGARSPFIYVSQLRERGRGARRICLPLACAQWHPSPPPPPLHIRHCCCAFVGSVCTLPACSSSQPHVAKTQCGAGACSKVSRYLCCPARFVQTSSRACGGCATTSPASAATRTE